MEIKSKFLCVLAGCLVLFSTARAQVFGDSELSAPSKTAKPTGAFAPSQAFPQNKTEQKQNLFPKVQIDTKTTQTGANPGTKNVNLPANKVETQTPPVESAPKAKKNLPSAVKQYKIVNGKKVEEEASEAIYIFYTDFKMVRNYGSTACDMRFVLLTKLEETLSEIGLRLVWPNATVKLNFSNVKPAERNFYDYRMYGDGCYSMDKLPNVTVNRCRVKGLSQPECAALIRIMKENG